MLSFYSSLAIPYDRMKSKTNDLGRYRIVKIKQNHFKANRGSRTGSDTLEVVQAEPIDQVQEPVEENHNRGIGHQVAHTGFQKDWEWPPSFAVVAAAST